MAENQPDMVEHEIEEVPESIEPEVKQEPEDNTAVEGGEKRWPGWPGESVFRMLVPVQKVGSIIGRKGEFIKKMCEETRARIKILDGPPGTSERAVMVSAKEEPHVSLPPAIDGLLKVHMRIVDGLDDDSSNALPAVGGKVSTRLLVPAAQAGSLIGKQGSTVKSIQEASSCIVRVLDDLPIFALQDDRIVEVVGEPSGVHKAIELIASHLRKFLVDRSITPLFEMQMQMANSQIDHHNMAPPPQSSSWGPPPPSQHQSFLPPATSGYGANNPPHYMTAPSSRQHENYYPHSEMGHLPSMEKQPHQGISAYGREPPIGGVGGGAHGLSAANNAHHNTATSMITQVTQQMQIPLAYADAVIGTAGSSISYIRRASGATVAIQETRGVPGEMTVEMSGTASQVQAAQQLIQNFMAGAGAPAQAQAGGSIDQGGYNSASYSAGGGGGGSVYSSPPSSQAYGGVQAAPGGYGSSAAAAYGSNNYGY